MNKAQMQVMIDSYIEQVGHLKADVKHLEAQLADSRSILNCPEDMPLPSWCEQVNGVQRQTAEQLSAATERADYHATEASGFAETLRAISADTDHLDEDGVHGEPDSARRRPVPVYRAISGKDALEHRCRGVREQARQRHAGGRAGRLR
jgi:hypothetical protein